MTFGRGACLIQFRAYVSPDPWEHDLTSIVRYTWPTQGYMSAMGEDYA